MGVRLWSAQGEPLLVDLDEDIPYRRTGAGFRPPEAREFRDGFLDRDDGLRPHDCCHTAVEAEGIELEVEGEEDEEDES